MANRPTLPLWVWTNSWHRFSACRSSLGLRPLQITELARQAERVKFHRGHVITEAGSAGDAAFLIASGAAGRIEPAGSDGEVEPIEPGSLVGEMAMLVEHVYRRDRHRLRSRALPQDHPGRRARADGGGCGSCASLRAAHSRAPGSRGRGLAADRRRSRGVRDRRVKSRRQKSTNRVRRRRLSHMPAPPDDNILLRKRKAPNPGGGVGRKKRVMRRCREGSRHRRRCLSARRGALPMKSDTARCNYQIILVGAISMGSADSDHEIVTDCFSFPQFSGLPRFRTAQAPEPTARFWNVCWRA